MILSTFWNLLGRGRGWFETPAAALASAVSDFEQVEKLSVEKLFQVERC